MTTNTKRHIRTSTLKIRTIQGGIKKTRPDQIRTGKIAIPHNALLKRHPLQILMGKIRIVQVHSPRDGDGPSALEGGCAARGDFGVGGETGAFGGGGGSVGDGDRMEGRG